MKLGRTLLISPPLACLLTWGLLAFPDGPYPRLTGGFNEETCVSCHNSHPLNLGRTLGGTLQVSGVPRNYEKGVTYPIRVAISHPGQSRWGFELSARFAGNGEQAGDLVPIDESTQVRKARGVQYIEHTEEGTRLGQADGPVEFQFNWTAPDPESGPVLFNAAGNAANGNNKVDGDYIYTAGAYSAGSVAAAPLLVENKPLDRRPARLTDDSRVAHLPAPVNLNKGNVQVLIQHRFLGSFIRNGAPDAGTAFGVDFGANINLETAYALTDRISVSASRARFDQIVTFAGTYEIKTDDDSPWKMAVRGGLEGQNNFEDHYSGFVELTSQFDYKFFRGYVVPIFVFNSREDDFVAPRRDIAVNPDDNNTFSLGFGADVELNRRLSLVGEYIPRLAGFGGIGNDRAAISAGMKIRTWGHVFHVLLSSSRIFTPAQYGVNATTTDYALGFNIYRKVGR